MVGSQYSSKPGLRKCSSRAIFRIILIPACAQLYGNCCTASRRSCIKAGFRRQHEAPKRKQRRGRNESGRRTSKRQERGEIPGAQLIAEPTSIAKPSSAKPSAVAKPSAGDRPCRRHPARAGGRSGGL